MTTPSWSTCHHCGKRTYATRKKARHAARTLHPRRHMGNYKCESRSGWHIGHLPARILYGDATRADYYGTSAA